VALWSQDLPLVNIIVMTEKPRRFRSGLFLSHHTLKVTLPSDKI
jgi:hypothetical protein